MTTHDLTTPFGQIWATTLASLLELSPPPLFGIRDVEKYEEAISFLEAVGKALDPIVATLLNELEDTSGVSNSGSIGPSVYISDFVLPEFRSTIDTITEEAEEDPST